MNIKKFSFDDSSYILNIDFQNTQTLREKFEEIDEREEKKSENHERIPFLSQFCVILNFLNRIHNEQKLTVLVLDFEDMKVFDTIQMLHRDVSFQQITEASLEN